jgi:CheY-like chemotaxis protein
MLVGATILIAEDDFAFRDTVEDALVEEGHTVATARNGAEALVCLHRLARPALILLDLRMPVMDGVRFLNELRLRPDRDDFEVVVMSATVDLQWFQATPGVIRAMKKPFDIDEILEVASEFGRRHARRSSGR